MSIEHSIATRIKTLRKEQGLTLKELADTSGISRSMISLIERGETSPTATVLNKLADALSVSLASLLSSEASSQVESCPVSSKATQKVWQDPESGYQRRRLTPENSHAPIELTEITFPPGQRVVFDHLVQNISIHQQIWVMSGSMLISDEHNNWQLSQGDCLSMTLTSEVTFFNPGNETAHYIVALTSTANKRI